MQQRETHKPIGYILAVASQSVHHHCDPHWEEHLCWAPTTIRHMDGDEEQCTCKEDAQEWWGPATLICDGGCRGAAGPAAPGWLGAPGAGLGAALLPAHHSATRCPSDSMHRLLLSLDRHPRGAT